MAVEHYKAPRSQGQALGEIIILGSRKSQTLATFSLSTNTRSTASYRFTAEVRDQITPQLITQTSFMMTQSRYDRGSEAAHKPRPLPELSKMLESSESKNTGYFSES